MTREQIRELKAKLRKTVWITKQQTGKRPTKKDLLEAMEAMVRFTPAEKPKDTWHSPHQPHSMKELLKCLK